MKKSLLLVMAWAIFPASFALPTLAQSEAKAAATTAAAPTSGPRAEFLTELKVEQDKFMRLAEAIPAEKYTWRPAEGVRSFSEVFLHVAAANYNLPKLIGTPPPAGFNAQG